MRAAAETGAFVERGGRRHGVTVKVKSETGERRG